MVPENMRLFTVILATAATIIASQAVISGAFSLTQQAIQLGYLPRMDIHHTSTHAIGQIYIPILNWMMAAGVTFILIGFQTSDNLAGAYGIAVTGTMLTSTFLVSVVLSIRNRWPWYWVAPFLLAYMVLDGTFLAANLHKIPGGGWLPLALGAVIYFVMSTWLRGRDQAHTLMLRHSPTLEKMLANRPAGLVTVPRTRHLPHIRSQPRAPCPCPQHHPQQRLA